MGPGFVIADNSRLHIAARTARTGLIAITLTFRAAKFFCHATEAKLAAADVERALLSGIFGILAAFSMSIAIAPAFIIGRFSIPARLGSIS